MAMRRITIALIALLIAGPVGVAQTVTKPNIVLILADDVGCDAIGCYGGRSYPTPAIDRLAASGMRFTHCYSMPVCHPTRICLLTGRYPRRLNNPKWGSFPKDEEQATLAQSLRAAGYATSVAGKWQLSLLGGDLEQPVRMGFDEYSLFGWHEGPRYYDPLIYQNGRLRTDVSEQYGPDVYSDFLIEFMKRNKERPFFAFYSMALCHDVTDDLGERVPYGPRGRYDSYAEMMTAMDRMVGKIVAAVDDLGLREKTLILFTGDNGTAARSIIRAEEGNYIREPVISDYNGRQVPGGKGKLTDAGTNVPLIAAWPGVIGPGQVVDDLVDFSDFLPTLTELSGGTPPESITFDGQSFAARLRGDNNGPHRDWAYSERQGDYWVRTGRWKLYSDGAFFDMENDPLEEQRLDVEALSDEAAAAHVELSDALESVAFFNE